MDDVNNFSVDKLLKKLTIKTPEERIATLCKKTFYHITDWKVRKKRQKERKRLIRRLKKELFTAFSQKVVPKTLLLN